MTSSLQLKSPSSSEQRTCANMHTHAGAKCHLDNMHTVAAYMHMSHLTFWLNF